jgi:hypothetical protein
MALLEKYPVHVRRKIALGITGGVALVLIIVMVIVYSSQKGGQKSTDAASKISQFYATIIQSAQSYFGGDHVIIPK